MNILEKSGPTKEKIEKFRKFSKSKKKKNHPMKKVLFFKKFAARLFAGGLRPLWEETLISVPGAENLAGIS